MRKSIRAVAIVIKNNNILLMFRRQNGKEYYVLPGGGVEDNESVENATLRELSEETTIKAKIKKLLYEHHYTDDGDQYYFLCDYTSGEPMLGEGIEKEKMAKHLEIYKPEWVKLSNLKSILLYPLEIRDWIIQDFPNFENAPRKTTLRIIDLRQTF